MLISIFGILKNTDDMNQTSHTQRLRPYKSSILVKGFWVILKSIFRILTSRDYIARCLRLRPYKSLDINIDNDKEIWIFWGISKSRDDRNKYDLSCQTSQTETETGSSLQPIQVTFRFNISSGGADNMLFNHPFHTAAISNHKTLRNVEKLSISKSTNVLTKMIFGADWCDGDGDGPGVNDYKRKTATLPKWRTRLLHKAQRFKIKQKWKRPNWPSCVNLKV